MKPAGDFRNRLTNEGTRTFNEKSDHRLPRRDIRRAPDKRNRQAFIKMRDLPPPASPTDLRRFLERGDERAGNRANFSVRGIGAVAALRFFCFPENFRAARRSGLERRGVNGSFQFCASALVKRGKRVESGKRDRANFQYQRDRIQSGADRVRRANFAPEEFER